MGTKRVLIVTPHFPPVNAPDMQRVRMSLPHFEEFGWTPFVLAVAPTDSENVEPLLCGAIPADVTVERVRSLPASLTRLFGVGNIALRALPYLYRAGCRLIEEHQIDLVFFSTTMFFAMPLGRLWKRKYRVPYVLDFQDPWVTDYYETHPEAQPPAKYGMARRLHAILEPWTVKEADGLLAVSSDYIDALQTRYASVKSAPAATLPFGASPSDLEVIESHPQPNRHFSKSDGQKHGVYVGVVGDVMSTALNILFEAFKLGIEWTPSLFGSSHLHFIGTDYAPAGRARKTVEPIAARVGVADRVSEDTTRAPYFEALQLLKDADFLIVVGSNDPGYTASKIYPYIMARKPLLAVVHEKSTVVKVINDTRAGSVVTFPSSPTAEDIQRLSRLAAESWRAILVALPYEPQTNWQQFERYTAREMTRQQCDLFDRVIARRERAAA